VNLARLNHILIPDGFAGREQLRRERSVAADPLVPVLEEALHPRQHHRTAKPFLDPTSYLGHVFFAQHRPSSAERA